MSAPAARANSELPGRVRLAAAGGALGPAIFIGAWLTGAAITDMPYSAFEDTISRLAAVGADTRGLMSAGLIGFGVAVPVYALALRRALPGRAWTTAMATGLASFGVVATPLDHSTAVDVLHLNFAGIGYVTLAATPLLAARPLVELGHRPLAVSGIACGLLSVACLVASLSPLPSGLFQRIGLTSTDIWLAASGIAIAAGWISRLAPGRQERRERQSRRSARH